MEDLLNIPPLEIWQVVLDTPLYQHFDYLPPSPDPSFKLQPGMRVRVPWGRRKLVGILIAVVKKTQVPINKLRPIMDVLDKYPLFSEKTFKLAHWAADYYHAPLGQMLFKILPSLLRKGRLLKYDEKIFECSHFSSSQSLLHLTSEQQKAANHIQACHSFKPILLAGITGSGKTEVYLHAIEDRLLKKQQILVLIPEISLIPQTVHRIRESFSCSIGIYHSGLTGKERLKTWQACFENNIDIVIGTRSAIFLPLLRLGLIIIDEEHDLSFKSQEGIRFNARDLAILRAKHENICIVLGSATPCLETLYNVKLGRFEQLNLSERPQQVMLPEVTLLDIRDQTLSNGLSDFLIKKIKIHLENQHQVLLFLNRRGFAPVMMCDNCDYIAECEHCDVRLVYHHQSKQLQCHHCSKVVPIPTVCPECKRKQLVPIGQGTERLEATLRSHFPNTLIHRIDKDNMKHKGALEKTLTSIHEGGAQILLGTQMLAKGHDFPQLTLVAIVDADTGLYGVDFRATERLGQLLIQVAGRAGRSHLKSEVILQTRHPQHPLLQFLKQHDYKSFSETLLNERCEMSLPPYSYMSLIRAQSKNKEATLHFLNHTKLILSKTKNSQVCFLGPGFLPIAKKSGFFRAQLLLQSKNRTLLHQMIKKFIEYTLQSKSNGQIKWLIDVDPMEIF